MIDTIIGTTLALVAVAWLTCAILDDRRRGRAEAAALAAAHTAAWLNSPADAAEVAAFLAETDPALDLANETTPLYRPLRRDDAALPTSPTSGGSTRAVRRDDALLHRHRDDRPRSAHPPAL